MDEKCDISLTQKGILYINTPDLNQYSYDLHEASIVFLNKFIQVLTDIVQKKKQMEETENLEEINCYWDDDQDYDWDDNNYNNGWDDNNQDQDKNQNNDDFDKIGDPDEDIENFWKIFKIIQQNSENKSNYIKQDNT